ncbi:hypothetical protein KIH87_17165 [Paraneptunicella aestuarii]|uniref:hypothetical protein n=1 Tax=Paraneptunicella aestuarii TaxID=2831148 RepID=UPI001E5E0DE5|nr:hypothetical protein [Paraneptunicella aestuarii]UAA38393.1 hypothetical protein KIH87_17165 [Paraneptunicella aestuarii]
MDWAVQYTYLNQEPALAFYIILGLGAGFFVGGGLYVIFKFRGLVSNPYFIVILSLLGALLAYVTYIKNIASYSVLNDRVKEEHKGITLQGQWSSTPVKVKQYHAEKILVGENELVRFLRQQVYVGCLWKPLHAQISKKKYKDSLIKLSYVVFAGEGPTDYQTSEKIKLDQICIFEILIAEQAQNGAVNLP